MFPTIGVRRDAKLDVQPEIAIGRSRLNIAGARYDLQWAVDDQPRDRQLPGIKMGSTAIILTSSEFFYGNQGDQARYSK